MTDLSVGLLAALLLWGTVAGLDLVTFPQAMISRPLVAGGVSGLLAGLLGPEGGLAGALGAGLVIGSTMELYALDVLPVGAARYPDYGPATVAAVYAGLDWPLHQAIGSAVLVGLLTAVLGGWMIQAMRRSNARAIQRRAAALSAGDPRAVSALQMSGIRRDIGRSAAVTLAGLVLAEAIWPLLPPGAVNYGWLSTVALGGGVAAALSGVVRSAGRTRRLAWVAGGVAAGTLGAVLR